MTFKKFDATNYDGHPANAIREVGVLHGVEVRVYASVSAYGALAQAVIGTRVVEKSVFEVKTAEEAAAKVKCAISARLRAQ